MERMPTPISDLDLLLATMAPVRNPGAYVFATLPPAGGVDAAGIVASMREPEGLSVIVEEACAHRLGLAFSFRAAWITLGVASDLHAVGLTAAVATVLSAEGISCNVVAGTCHDHLFVPLDRADDALAALQAMQRRASASGFGG